MKFLKSFSLFENLQQAKSILSKLGIDENDPVFRKIKELLKTNVGYIGWFTKMLFENGVPYQSLEDLYKDTIVARPEVVNALPKNLITYIDWEKLMDDIILASNNIGIRRMLNELPNLQRSLINDKSEQERELSSLNPT